MLFAAVDAVVWKGIYHQGIPNKNSISSEYCKNHTPGMFIHSVKNVLNKGIVTSNGIKLDHATFREEKKYGIYFINGDLLSHGKTGDVKWNDHIYYYLYKLTKYGLTQGVWSTNKCKGLYTGMIIGDIKHSDTIK